jgi:hypothetical protein
MSSSKAEVIEETTSQEQQQAQPGLQTHQYIQNLERYFNEHFLRFLVNQNEGLSDIDEDKAREQWTIANEAYQYWYNQFKEDINTSEASLRYFESVKVTSKLMLARDTQFFFQDNIDICALIFNAPGYDTMFRYNMYDHTSQGKLWKSFVDMFRLSVLNSIYINMPEVRRILDILLKNNTNINATNLMSCVLSSIKNNKEFQKLLRNLMKQGDDKVMYIFESVQYVVSTIQADVTNPMEGWLTKAEVTTRFTQDIELKICQSFNTDKTQECVDNQWVTVDELERMKVVWAADKELQENVKKFMWSKWSNDIQEMMATFNTGNTEDIEKMIHNNSMFRSGMDTEMTDILNDLKTEMELHEENLDVPSNEEEDEEEVPELTR